MSNQSDSDQSVEQILFFANQPDRTQQERLNYLIHIHEFKMNKHIKFDYYHYKWIKHEQQNLQDRIKMTDELPNLARRTRRAYIRTIEGK